MGEQTGWFCTSVPSLRWTLGTSEPLLTPQPSLRFPRQQEGTVATSQIWGSYFCASLGISLHCTSVRLIPLTPGRLGVPIEG